MKILFIITFVLIFNAILVADVKQDKLHKQYSSLATPRERLDFCIDLIDKGVIDIGVSYQYLKGIFGDNLWIASGRVGKERAVIRLRFSPQTFSKDVTMASSWVGWYLHLEFEPSGKLEKYWLSNLHK